MEFGERIAPQEAIADCFVNAIFAAGGLPLQMSLTTDEDVIADYVAMADGIAIPGGPDVNPARWGDESPYDPALLCEERDAFEFPLVKAALEADVPLFTTCRGTQLANVALGGTLCMDVPSLGTREGMVQWRHERALNVPIHPVEVEPDTLLARSIGDAVGAGGLIQTNSWHHCCVDRLGEGVVVTAHATDGIPECIEVPSQRFFLGVQWHPEYTWPRIEADFNLWRAFVAAAAETTH